MAGILPLGSFTEIFLWLVDFNELRQTSFAYFMNPVFLVVAYPYHPCMVSLSTFVDFYGKCR